MNILTLSGRLSTSPRTPLFLPDEDTGCTFIESEHVYELTPLQMIEYQMILRKCVRSFLPFPCQTLGSFPPQLAAQLHNLNHGNHAQVVFEDVRKTKLELSRACLFDHANLK